jgi:putative DNA primase/helicase
MNFTEQDAQHQFAPITDPEGRTDLANAGRFVAMFGDDARWCEPWKQWLIWDGKRWRQDDCRLAEARAKLVADEVWERAKQAMPQAGHATGKELLRYAHYTASAGGIGAMLSLARSSLAILPDALDSHNWLFNTTSGTVDLRTGKLLPHDREHYLTKLCPHAYGDDAECPLWLATLDKIFAGRQDVLTFFRRLCGVAMTGEVSEHLLPILWGGGSNGKSLVVETLLAAMGKDFACAGAENLLLVDKSGRHPTEVATLHGKRLVVCSETDEGKRLAEARVKKLTGGDQLNARKMRQDEWQFTATHSLWLTTNHKPVVKDDSDGIWRRLRLIPFTQRFWDGSKGETGPDELRANLNLLNELKPELPGILGWMVAGCLEWQQYGLGQPDEVTAATNEYRDSQNVFSRFLLECATIGAGGTVKRTFFRERYERWCREVGEKPQSDKTLWPLLAKLGVTSRTSNGTWYDGICLKDFEQETF